MSSNKIHSLTKEYDTLSEKVRKTSRDLDDAKHVLVTTTDMFLKGRNTDMN